MTRTIDEAIQEFRDEEKKYLEKARAMLQGSDALTIQLFEEIVSDDNFCIEVEEYCDESLDDPSVCYEIAHMFHCFIVDTYSPMFRMCDFLTIAKAIRMYQFEY